MPAFDTPTGIPVGTVNLRYGVPEGETREANVAGAGSLIVEWGLLSRLTGEPKYEAAARKALESVWAKRSTIDLVGTHINIDSGDWTEQVSGIGAGVDSLYEYMLKGYLLFGDNEYLTMFKKGYDAVMKYQRKGPWYADVHMISGAVAQPVFNALAAFWPGLQSMTGEHNEATTTLDAYFEVWRRFGFTPEGFNFVTKEVQEGQTGYPLRPEMAESAWYMYRATQDSKWQESAADMVDSIDKFTRVSCGFAAIEDVRSHQLADHMDSYFLAETLKYLYLMFDDDNWLVQHYGGFVFNTEGHILPLNYKPHEDSPSKASLQGSATCKSQSRLERLAAQGFAFPFSSLNSNNQESKASLGCIKCGNPVAAPEPINVPLPPGVTSHQEVALSGTVLVHKFVGPEGEERELSLLRHSAQGVKIAETGLTSKIPGLELTWKVVTCAKCGHFLGFMLERETGDVVEDGAALGPQKFAGFFVNSISPLAQSQIKSMAGLAPVEAMQKFLTFAQQTLGRIPQKATLTLTLSLRMQPT